jgi:hypothetical protein
VFTLDPDLLSDFQTIVPFDDVPEAASAMIAGRTRGRLVVDLS